MKNALAIHILLITIFIAFSNSASNPSELEIVSNYGLMGIIIAGCLFSGYLASKLFTHLR